MQQTAIAMFSTATWPALGAKGRRTSG
ncbi:unnamed protein product [Discula destructiva]